jgi:hypothetical protein
MIPNATALWARLRLSPGVSLSLRVSARPAGAPPPPPASAARVVVRSDGQPEQVVLLASGLRGGAAYTDVRVVSAVEPLLAVDGVAVRTMREGYQRLRLRLGKPGVTRRAAAEILDQVQTAAVALPAASCV